MAARCCAKVTIIFSGGRGGIVAQSQQISNTMMALSLFLMLLLAGNSALSARIAGFCAVGGSQYINTRHTLEELANRGHEVEKN